MNPDRRTAMRRATGIVVLLALVFAVGFDKGEDDRGNLFRAALIAT